MQEKAKLKKYNITIAKLWDIILRLSEEQQEILLRQVDNMLKADQREFVRKACDLEIDFAASNRTHKGRIKNISRLGVFIEARAPVIIGEEVLMVFRLDPDVKAVKLRGEVAHATRWGIGVEFTSKEPQFNLMIANLIQRLA
jgi:hypothetical protein